MDSPSSSSSGATQSLIGMPQPVGAPIYDPAWYQGNSREDPATVPVQPIIDPQNIDGNTTYSQRSKDQWAKYIANQRRGGPHAPLIIKNPPPPKLEQQGCWQYIEYVPEWTDPLWHDSKLEVESNGGSQYLVRPHDVLRYLRPAHLPQDRAQNPTAMATRYGIYPDRRDGRSRMTPTRQVFSRFAVNGTKPDAFDGKFVWGHVDVLAQKEGMDVDDLLKKYSSLTKDEVRNLPGVDEFALRAMVQMQDDEDWQRALLQGLSTNELVEAGIMSFENTFQSDLTLRIHPILQKDNWGETFHRGMDEDTPRLIYQTANRKGEWSIHTDDFLWERLQPALALASRYLWFLQDHDPFWVRLLDVFNRVPVDGERDDRPESQRQKVPSHTFSMLDTTATSVGSEEVRLTMDPVEETLELLHRRIDFSIGSGFHEAGEAETSLTAGLTTLIGDDLISVVISADSIWPLLVEGYSKDEQAMCAFNVASTIIHEIAHAVNYAHYILFVHPGPSQIDQLDGEDKLQKICEDIGKHVFGTEPRHHMEPFFEREPRAELGYCMESHLFGGTCWPLLTLGPLRAKHLEFLPSGIGLTRWPSALLDAMRPNSSDLARNPKNLILTRPHLPARTHVTPVQVSQIRRFFTDAFWEREVPRFGAAALHLLSDTPGPQIIMPQMHEEFPEGSLKLAEASHFANQYEAYPDEIRENNPIVWHFVEMVTHEFLRFSSAIFTWRRDFRSWRSRLVAIRQKVAQLGIQSEELALASHHAQKRAAGTSAVEMSQWEQSRIVLHTRLVNELRRELTDADFVMPDGSGEIYDSRTDSNQFWYLITTRPSNDAHPRMASLLRLLHEDCACEVQILQELYLDIYKLDTGERARMTNQSVIKNLQGRLNCLMRAFNDVSVIVSSLGESGFPDDMVSGFEAKFLGLRQTTSQLQGWAGDVESINPSNWQQLLPIIPNIDKAKRPASVRMAKIAQKEISLMPAAMLAPVAKYLRELKKENSEGAKLVNVDNRPDVNQILDTLTNQPKIEKEKDTDELERAIPAFDRFKRDRADDDVTGYIRPKRPMVRTSFAAAIVPKRLRGARHAFRPSDPLWDDKFAHKTTMKDTAKVFGNIPVVNFGQGLPLAPNGPDPMVGVRPDPALPPPIQPLQIFPSPYALTATFTGDLAHAAATAGAQAPPQQQQAPPDFGKYYREPPGPPMSPMSSDSQRTASPVSEISDPGAGAGAGVGAEGAAATPAGSDVDPFGLPISDGELEGSDGGAEGGEGDTIAVQTAKRRRRRRRAPGWGMGGGDERGEAMDWEADGMVVDGDVMNLD